MAGTSANHTRDAQGYAHDGDDGRMSFPKILETLESVAERDTVSAGDVLDAFGSRAYGPIFFVIGLVAASPVGAIPGASIFSAVLIALVAIQMTFRRGAPWVPRRLRNASVEGHRFRAAVYRLEPWLERLAVITRPRYGWLIRGPGTLVLVAAHLVFAASMVPLALVPFGVLLPAVAVLVLGLAQAVDDGLLSLVGGGIGIAGLILGLTVAPMPI